MSFELTILGAQGALPVRKKYSSAHYLKINQFRCLIDCGEGIQHQMLTLKIPLLKLNVIFISHLHGDHYLGLAGILFTMHLQHRVKPLIICGPKGLDDLISLQLKLSNTVLRYELIFCPTNPEKAEVIFQNKVVSVETIPLSHKLPCCGFLIKERPKPFRIDKEKLDETFIQSNIGLLTQGKDILNDDGSVRYAYKDYTLPPRPSYAYAYCSDTTYHPTICDQIRGVDLLYHEATFKEEDLDKAIATKHSTTKHAASIALEANVKRLIIGHFSARYKRLQSLLAEAQSIFPKTTLAAEGDHYVIPYED